MAECDYREVDRQLKEQLMHGLNDKSMLDEVIRELTMKNNNEQTTSEDVLAWAKRIEALWAQTAILSDITRVAKILTKLKWFKKNKSQAGHRNNTPSKSQTTMQILWGKPCAKTVSSIWKNMSASCGKMGHFKKVCRSRRDWQAVHEVEVDTWCQNHKKKK